MRSSGWCLMVASVLGPGFLSASVAQQPTGPATLENAVTPAEVPKRRSASEARTGDAGAVRPAGMLSRPKDGAQHADLDKAWADYDAAMLKAVEGIKSAIAKQFDAATAKGDLDTAEKWQAALEKFEQAGECPSANETKAAVSSALIESKKAEGNLFKAYEAVVKTFTKEKKIAEARKAKDESAAMIKTAEKLRDKPDLMLPQKGKEPKPKAIFLSDLDERDVIVHGLFRKNGGDGFVVVRGVPSKKALFMHPPANGTASVTYEVPDGFSRFEAVAAINDSAENIQTTPLTFRVVSDDGSVLWTSEPLLGGGSVDTCSVLLKGAKKIQLTVNCPGAFWHAHGVWCEPRFVVK